MTANATAALSYRARAGLREAWLQADLKDGSSSPGCRWTTDRLSGYVGGKLTERERKAVAEHLATCTKCSSSPGNSTTWGSWFAFVLVPLLVGSGVGATPLASGSEPASAATAAPPLPTNLPSRSLVGRGRSHRTRPPGAGSSSAGRRSLSPRLRSSRSPPRSTAHPRRATPRAGITSSPKPIPSAVPSASPSPVPSVVTSPPPAAPTVPSHVTSRPKPARPRRRLRPSPSASARRSLGCSPTASRRRSRHGGPRSHFGGR